MVVDGGVQPLALHCGRQMSTSAVLYASSTPEVVDNCRARIRKKDLILDTRLRGYDMYLILQEHIGAIFLAEARFQILSGALGLLTYSGSNPGFRITSLRRRAGRNDRYLLRRLPELLSF